jgi:probable addiction module antidote protein
MKTELTAFDASRYLDSEEMIAEYLTAAAEEDDPDLLLKALSDVAKARGMALVAREAGLGRESLYKALAPGAHPRFETIHAVLRALRVQLSVQPARPGRGRQTAARKKAPAKAVAKSAAGQRGARGAP